MAIERTIEVGFKVKRFYCDTKDVCYFKQHYINQRCFAPYVVRASCRYLASKERAEILARE